MQLDNRIKLLLVTNGVNRCAEYLRQLDGIELDILDLNQGHVGTKGELEQYILYVRPDLLFVYRCPFVISKKAYSIARFGAYNIHPSLLPKYRGLNPWPKIFENKEVENGVTLHRITDVVDGGEIIYQYSYAISPDDTIESARNNADIIASRLLEKFMDEYIPEHEDFIDLYPLPNKFDYIEAVVDKSNLLIDDILNEELITEGTSCEYYEGAYSIVFRMKFQNKEMALRCWKCIGYDDCAALCRRMKCIGDELDRVKLPYFIGFGFYERGIVTCKGIYPVMLMDWISYPDLKQYIRDNLYDKRRLDALAKKFVVMVAELHVAKIAHGDLQVANIKVKEDGSLLLIDYDTLFTPSLLGEPDRVKGNLCFQHHSRLDRESATPFADYFSEYIIYFGIVALANYPQLYTYLNLDENDFIFTQEELYDISNSRICKYINLKNNKLLIAIITSLIEAWNASNIDTIIPLENIFGKKQY